MASYLLLGLFLFALTYGEDLPTNYEYYTSDGIVSGLSADQPGYFTLNGKNFTLLGGTMHYFRIPRAYWRTSMKQIRAAGLNTIETYMAWNLHEPHSGVFDFGDGGSDMEDFLHLEEYLQIAQEEDLFVLLRPGPYICAEFTFGAFPSWLLREKEIGFRTADKNYLQYVERYFNEFLPMVAKYQFTKNGSIIGFQIENEYGFNENPEEEYLQALYQYYIQNGIVELLMTSDPVSFGMRGTLGDVMYHTLNFGDDPDNKLSKLLEMQPDKPVMVMEFWAGWYDFWGEERHAYKNATVFKDYYERVLKFPGSANIYTFIGGYNYGSLNGAALSNQLLDNSGFRPMTSSYDYDSPITESGDYTQKFYDVRELTEKYNPVKTFTPDPPEARTKVAYDSIRIQNQMPLREVLQYHAPYVIESENVIAMEMLDINNSSGQNFGYIVYRKENVDLEANTVLTIQGHVCDTVMVLVDGVLVSPEPEDVEDMDYFGFWRLKDSTLILNEEAKSNVTIDLVVEEWGRMDGGGTNWLQYNVSLKGLWQGDVLLNDEKVTNWKIIPLELTKSWVNGLYGWSYISTYQGPSLYYVDLQIDDEPSDTYIDMRRWGKGTVMVNGFRLGKHFKIGPQLALYLPGALLDKGSNRIVFFEHFSAPDEVTFSTGPVYNS